MISIELVHFQRNHDHISQALAKRFPGNVTSNTASGLKAHPFKIYIFIDPTKTEIDALPTDGLYREGTFIVSSDDRTIDFLQVCVNKLKLVKIIPLQNTDDLLDAIRTQQDNLQHIKDQMEFREQE